MIGANAKVLPEMLDVVDADEVARKTALALSVPASMMRTEDEVQQVRKQRQEQQEQMAQAEIAKTAGEAQRAQAQAANEGQA